MIGAIYDLAAGVLGVSDVYADTLESYNFAMMRGDFNAAQEHRRTLAELAAGGYAGRGTEARREPVVKGGRRLAEEGDKKSLTNLVRQLESKPSTQGQVDLVLGRFDHFIVWTDSSLLPEVIGGWSSYQNLLERARNVRLRSLPPGRLAPEVAAGLPTASGTKREEDIFGALKDVGGAVKGAGGKALGAGTDLRKWFEKNKRTIQLAGGLAGLGLVAYLGGPLIRALSKRAGRTVG